MHLHPEPQPIVASDDEILAALSQIETPPLLVAVASLTGDLSVLRDDLRPSAPQSFDPTAGITPQQAETARRIAADALARHRDAGNPMVSRPDPSTVRAMLEFMAGMPIEDDYVELMTEELAIAGADHRDRKSVV